MYVLRHKKSLKNRLSSSFQPLSSVSMKKTKQIHKCVCQQKIPFSFKFQTKMIDRKSPLKEYFVQMTLIGSGYFP